MRDGYQGNSNLKKAGTKLEFTQEQLLEFTRCIRDPIYFIKKYVKIVNVDYGLVPFDMWPFQKEMVEGFHANRFSICKMPRQVGKTTSVAGYMLWNILFQDNYTVAILANKGALAREILDRIKYAYEHIPHWLQQGVLEWNKGNIELENGSKIFAYATSGSGVRGGTYNLIFLDEFAFVPHNMAQDFFTSTYPVISSGKTTKVIIVSTPNGLNMFYKMWMDSIEGRSLYTPFEVHWSMVPGRDEKWKEETIRNTSEEQFRQEFETEFIGSSATLIPGSKLKTLTFRPPIHKKEDTDTYEEPIPGHTYMTMVDCSEGVGLDYSVISVVDVTEIPYKQVLKYRNNKISPLILPTYIYNIANKYNRSFVLVETNNVGKQVVDILHYDLEYENIFRLEYHEIKGQNISSGFKRGASFGLKTTISTKKIGCANLKTLIENDKLIIYDFDTIAELNTFVRDKDTYKAEEGNNDDIVMTLVFFSWLTAQSYFKEVTNSDIRQKLLDERNLQLDEETLPVGFINDGQQEEKTFDGKDLWETVRSRGYTSSGFEFNK
jgi:hypothetical protein